MKQFSELLTKIIKEYGDNEDNTIPLDGEFIIYGVGNSSTKTFPSEIVGIFYANTQV